jgi:hypothetical protein
MTTSGTKRNEGRKDGRKISDAKRGESPPATSRRLTGLRLQNFGHPNTNCTASKRFDFPEPFLPTTQFISDEKGCISGCCLKERKFDRVIDLMCMIEMIDDYYYFIRLCTKIFSWKEGMIKINAPCIYLSYGFFMLPRLPTYFSCARDTPAILGIYSHVGMHSARHPSTNGARVGYINLEEPGQGGQPT